MKTQILILTILVFSIFGCTNKDAEEATKLEEETTKLHDEVMPITFKIRDLRDSVLKKAEVMKDSTLKNEGVKIANQIQDADNEMDDFMSKLGDALNNGSKNAEKIKVFGELKTEGETVKQKTLTAKNKAEEYLKK